MKLFQYNIVPTNTEKISAFNKRNKVILIYYIDVLHDLAISKLLALPVKGLDRKKHAITMYDDVEECRNIILNENKDKSGIFMWFNNANAKAYDITLHHNTFKKHICAGLLSTDIYFHFLDYIMKISRNTSLIWFDFIKDLSLLYSQLVD